IGCFGVRPMVAELGKNLPLPRIVIVGEPTEMKVVDAHKGPIRWQMDIKGRPAHSSMSHLGVNAITWAGHLLGELSKIEEDLKHKTLDPRFEPPYSTFQVTKIEGGTASNIIPSSCTLGFEARALDADEIPYIEDRIQNFITTTCSKQISQKAPEAGISFFRTNYVPPFKTEKNSEAVALALALGSQNETAAVSYATEAGFFQNAGSSAVVCGPGRIAEAHTANEWIAETELEKCLQFLKKLGEWCAH
ncbi:MAG: M20/M25/M40 family metallo-hydrolase, partial [Hyphomicrobium sp.]